MNKLNLLSKLTFIGLVGTVSIISFQETAKAYQIFFGEDLGLGETTRLPVDQRPNSDAAQADFLSKLMGIGTEDFETIPVGSTTPLNLIFPGSTGNITATLVDSGSVENIPTGTNGFGRYPSSGDQLFNDVSSELDIFFDQDIAAFGFVGIDVGDFDGQIIADIRNDGVLIESILIDTTINAPGGSITFFGIIAEGAGEFFDEIDFLDTAPGVDFFGYDEMTIGDPQQIIVPEPGTILGLLAVGGLGLGLKRKKQS
jgi:hypothetical protein